MSKASLCIQMLRLLNTGKIFKASELADRLETNTRNIFEYKTELEDAGYLIESIPGRYGGYRLVKSGLFPVKFDDIKCAIHSFTTTTVKTTKVSSTILKRIFKI